MYVCNVTRCHMGRRDNSFRFLRSQKQYNKLNDEELMRHIIVNEMGVGSINEKGRYWMKKYVYSAVFLAHI